MTRQHRAVGTDVAAKLFRGLADPTRLAILLELVRAEQRVTDLVASVGTSQANVSTHVACLKECGLIADRPQGRQVFYRIAVPQLYQLLSSAELVLEATGTAIELCPQIPSARTKVRRGARG